jgi:hypothetical protein
LKIWFGRDTHLYIQSAPIREISGIIEISKTPIIDTMATEEQEKQADEGPAKRRPRRREAPARSKSVEDYGSLAVMRRKAKSTDEVKRGGKDDDDDDDEEEQEIEEVEMKNESKEEEAVDAKEAPAPKRRGGRRKVPARTKSCDDMVSMKKMSTLARQKSKEENERNDRGRKESEVAPTE